MRREMLQLRYWFTQQRLGAAGASTQVGACSTFRLGQLYDGIGPPDVWSKADAQPRAVLPGARLSRSAIRASSGCEDAFILRITLPR